MDDKSKLTLLWMVFILYAVISTAFMMSFIVDLHKDIKINEDAIYSMQMDDLFINRNLSETVIAEMSDKNISRHCWYGSGLDYRFRDRCVEDLMKIKEGYE